MSHFVMAVITPNKPTQEELENILMPWHEYECTGYDNEYVVKLDMTKEVEESFNEESFFVKKPDGSFHFQHEKEFQVPDNKKDRGIFAQTHFELPQDCELVKMTHGAFYATRGIDRNAFGKEYCGYEQEPGDPSKSYHKTNPNKKWDWWTIGGRYSNRLTSKATGEQDNQCSKGDLDLDKMLEHRKDALTDYWNEEKASYEKDPHSKVMTFEQALQVIHDEGEVNKPENDETRKALAFALFSDFHETPSLDLYLSTVKALSAFGVVKDGLWYEKGAMGWWGVVHDEKDENKWTAEFDSLIKGLPDSHWITIVDCHI